MPLYDQNTKITEVRLGSTEITEIRFGSIAVHPDNVGAFVITSAAWTDTSDLANTGGTRTYRVVGQEGSTYTLSGAITGTFTIGATGTRDHTHNPGDNSALGRPARQVSVTITPAGTTILDDNVNATSAFTQLAGPPEPALPGNYQITASASPSSGGPGTSVTASVNLGSIPSGWSVDSYLWASANRYWVGSPFPTTVVSPTVVFEGGLVGETRANINVTVTFRHSNGVTVEGITVTARFNF